MVDRYLVYYKFTRPIGAIFSIRKSMLGFVSTWRNLATFDRTMRAVLHVETFRTLIGSEHITWLGH